MVVNYPQYSVNKTKIERVEYGTGHKWNMVSHNVYIVTCQVHPVLVKSMSNVRSVSFFKFLQVVFHL